MRMLRWYLYYNNINTTSFHLSNVSIIITLSFHSHLYAFRHIITLQYL